MDKVRVLLALPAKDDAAAQRKVGDLLAAVIRDHKPIPEVDTVRRLLRVPAPTLEHPTLEQWLTG